MMDEMIFKKAAIDAAIEAADEWDGGCNPERKRMIEEAIMALPASNRWIPCSERLPKYGKTVLITNAKGNVSYGRFRGVEFWKEDGDSCWTWKKNTIEHVLAWMPLPEPYKEEEE